MNFYVQKEQKCIKCQQESWNHIKRNIGWEEGGVR